MSKYKNVFSGVKASAVAHLTDARYFAAQGVKWIGFDTEVELDLGQNINSVLAIKEWIDGVSIIGEFKTQEVPEILHWIREIDLDGIQINDSFPEGDLNQLPKGLFVIVQLKIPQSNDLDVLIKKMETFQSVADCFLLSVHDGNIDQINLQFLCSKYSIILEWNATPAQLPSFLEEVTPYGIAVRGSNEEKVGFKSFEELDEIFEELAI